MGLSLIFFRNPRRSAQLIECEIEFENIDSRLTDQAEESPPLVRPDQCLDLGGRKGASASHASGLIARGRGANVRIETTSRCGHELENETGAMESGRGA